MAYDEGTAEILREDLSDLEGIEEKRMFGGLCFMWRGNMLCGAYREGGMFRVGKDNQDAAQAIDGVGPMQFTGRKMGGLVDVTADVIEDDERRAQVLGLAKDFVGSLPPK